MEVPAEGRTEGLKEVPDKGLDRGLGKDLGTGNLEREALAEEAGVLGGTYTGSTFACLGPVEEVEVRYWNVLGNASPEIRAHGDDGHYERFQKQRGAFVDLRTLLHVYEEPTEEEAGEEGPKEEEGPIQAAAEEEEGEGEEVVVGRMDVVLDIPTCSPYVGGA